MRIPSGVTDQYIYFVGVDATDFATRETGLTGFTVYRSRNGGAAVAMTTPTVNETDSTNMPGVYELLLDEDMTIDAGNDSEEMAYHITVSGMAPVTRTIELYRPKITAGETLGVTSGAVDDVTLVATTTTNTDMRGTDSAATAASLATVDANVDAILIDTDTTIPGLIAGLNDVAATDIVSSGAITTLAGAVVNVDLVDTCTTNTDMRGTDSAATAVDLATVDANVDAILVDTGTTLPAQISGLNDLSAAEVNAEVDTALVDIHLDHLLAVDYDPASKPGTATALLNELIEDDSGVSRFTINALENAPSGTGASAEAIADAVWEETLADHSGTVGSTAEALDAAGGGGGATAAEIWSYSTRVLTANTNLNDLDAAEVRAAVGLAAANIDTQLSAIDTVVDAILVDTSTSGVVLAGTPDVNAAQIAGSVEAATDLSASAKTIVTGAAATGTLSTTQMTTDLAEATDDHYNGRIIIWTSGVLKDQATNITDYTGTGGLLTFTGVTEAPSNGDTFVIL